MNIDSPRGQDILRQAREATAIWEMHNKGWRLSETPQDQPCPVDGLLYFDGWPMAVVEIRCRAFDPHVFWNNWNGEWLMSEKKFHEAKRFAMLLAKPLVGWLYSTQTKTLFTRLLVEASGAVAVEYRTGMAKTRGGIYGGDKEESCVYINMRGSREYRHDGVAGFE